MNDTSLFDFESDFVATLRCVPMAVRFKLDACRIKLALRQWSRFTTAERKMLLLAPCETATEMDAYRTSLIDLIALRADSGVKSLEEVPQPLWEQSAETPEPVRAFARSICMIAPSNADWGRLSPLQRFALLKLSRDNHDNVNFVPALREFGLPTDRAVVLPPPSAEVNSGRLSRGVSS
jgi:hypothetical protein